MKRPYIFALGILVMLVLLLSMVTYRVWFDQSVVITTLGSAGENSVRNLAGDESGLHLKWPWPIQEVARVYDRRLLLLEDRLEQQQTRDQQSIVASAYIQWRISDPLKFYNTLSTVEQAERQLRDRLRDARGILGEFDFAELVGAGGKRSLRDVQGLLLARLQSDVEKLNYGIRIEGAGINRLILAETVTRKVLETMRQNRESLAQRARSEGAAVASDIRGKARSAEQRILAFAERRAQTIRAEGDKAAAQSFQVFQQDPEFAVFLRKIEEYRKVLRNNTTIFLDAANGPFDLWLESSLPATRPSRAKAVQE